MSYETDFHAWAIEQAALIRAEREAGFPRDTFPWTCPYTLDHILDPDF